MKAKKSLGQNFLKSSQVISDILKAASINAEDTVLEIGPGTGVLTRALLDAGAHVLSIEKDDRLIPELSHTFNKEIAEGRLTIIHGDVLEVDLDRLPQHYKLVANIPYYITGQIIRMFLEKNPQPTSITLLVQKEVADRIVTKDGKESLLSLSVKVYGEPKYIRTVGKGAFTPQPSVDSAVIHISSISYDKLKRVSSQRFFEVIHAGFAHKRKQLLPNLSQLGPKEKITDALMKSGIDPRARAEDIGIERWIDLAHNLS